MLHIGFVACCKKEQNMIQFFKDNAIWLTPVLVAIVSGVFYLLKKGGNHQTANKNSGCNITQVNGNNTQDAKQ